MGVPYMEVGWPAMISAWYTKDAPPKFEKTKALHWHEQGIINTSVITIKWWNTIRVFLGKQKTLKQDSPERNTSIPLKEKQFPSKSIYIPNKRNRSKKHQDFHRHKSPNPNSIPADALHGGVQFVLAGGMSNGGESFISPLVSYPQWSYCAFFSCGW